MPSKAASRLLPEPWKQQSTRRFSHSFELRDHRHALELLPVICSVTMISYREISLQLHANTVVVEIPYPIVHRKADPYVIKLAKDLNMVAGPRTRSVENHA